MLKWQHLNGYALHHRNVDETKPNTKLCRSTCRRKNMRYWTFVPKKWWPLESSKCCCGKQNETPQILLTIKKTKMNIEDGKNRNENSWNVAIPWQQEGRWNERERKQRLNASSMFAIGLDAKSFPNANFDSMRSESWLAHTTSITFSGAIFVRSKWNSKTFSHAIPCHAVFDVFHVPPLPIPMCVVAHVQSWCLSSKAD